MAYDEPLARRVRGVLPDPDRAVEKKMFGGLAFLLSGHMCCGIVREDLMVRVGPEQYEEALGEPGAREMDFTGRPMKGMVYVDRTGLQSQDVLRRWVERGWNYASSLPPKKQEGPPPAKGLSR